MNDALTAEQVIDVLDLKPHPEGGWFKETFRDQADEGRAASTAIFYLLATGQVSAWHRVKDAAEVWHYYAGAPLKLSVAVPEGSPRDHVLGPDVAGGQSPQLVVPAGWWQSAQSLGPWTLTGCTVAPGFEFSAFEMAPQGWNPGGDGA